MPKPKYHVLICTNQRPEGHPRGSCGQKNAMAVWQKFADMLNRTNMYDKVLISGVRSCLGPCQVGPIVVVYPENVWYGNVKEEDVEDIFKSHFMLGKPVERLILPTEVFG
ncbi:MAG: (2Fe-2S) ferredoxin domain-containing protein [Nitrospinae bacterium]|nr:(2Fe-2S) ferredoxin domain-containing protein [Nitrospinota bacterium]